jgi:hypothetical protein
MPLHPSSTPVVNGSHDGLLESLVRTTGLIDVLRHHHPSPTYPATYNRGEKNV